MASPDVEGALVLPRAWIIERGHSLSFEDAYVQGVMLLEFQTSAALADLFLEHPSEQAIGAQEHITRYLAAITIAQSLTPLNERLKTIDFQELDERATLGLEQIVLLRTHSASKALEKQGKESLFMEAALSEAAMHAIVQRAMENFAFIHEFGKEAAGNAAWSHLLAADRVVRQFRVGGLTTSKAIEQAGHHLARILFKPQVEDEHHFEDLLLSPQAGKLHEVLTEYQMDAATACHFFAGAPLIIGNHEFTVQNTFMEIDKQRQPVEAIYHRFEQLVRTTFEKSKALHVWEGLSKAEQIQASMLIFYSRANETAKRRTLLRNPEMVQVFYKLPSDMRRALSSWTHAAEAALVVGKGAEAYADAATGTRGKFEKSVMLARRNFGEFITDFFSKPKDSNYPEGPRKPRWGRIFGTASAIGLAIIAACAKAHQTQTQTTSPTTTPEKHPSQTPSSVDLVATLQNSLVSQLSSHHVAIDSGCTIGTDSWSAMQTSGAALTADTQFSWLEAALSATTAPAIPDSARLVCALSNNSQTISVYLEADNIILIPTAGGLVEGQIVNGIAIPKPPPTPEVSYSAPYPANADNLLLGGGSTEQAWDTLIAFAPNDVAAQRAYFSAEFARMGIPASAFELVPMYNFSPDVNAWVIAAFNKSTGRYYVPAERHVNPNTGQVTHFIISSLSLFAYENHMPSDDFFDLIELKNPKQYPDARQQLVPDRSGWFVIGLFDANGNLVGYYDAGVDAWKDKHGTLLASTVIATVTPDKTATPIPTPTETSVPTPDKSRYILSASNAMPDSPLQAPEGKKTDYAAIIAALRREQSLLPADANPIEIGNIVDHGDGHKAFIIVCNIGNNNNCAPAALIKYKDVFNGKEFTDIVVLILEIKTTKTEQNPDGRGYIAKVIYQPEWPWTGVYDFWRQTPTEHWNMNFSIAFGQKLQHDLPYSTALSGGLLQPGFQEATNTFIATGDTSALEKADIVYP